MYKKKIKNWNVIFKIKRKKNVYFLFWLPAAIPTTFVATELLSDFSSRHNSLPKTNNSLQDDATTNRKEKISNLKRK